MYTVYKITYTLGSSAALRYGESGTAGCKEYNVGWYRVNTPLLAQETVPVGVFLLAVRRWREINIGNGLMDREE
jgi:hypothetical protein